VHHDHGDEADSRRKQHIPSRRKRIAGRLKATEPTVQRTHGLVSTSEWTGVPLATLLRQTGLTLACRSVLPPTRFANTGILQRFGLSIGFAPWPKGVKS
jgi:hypothetical protein